MANDPQLPVTPPIEPDDSTVHSQAYAVMVAKHGEAGAWATWAAELLLAKLNDLKDAIDQTDANALSDKITSLLELFDSMTAYTAPTSSDFEYTPATAPTYETVPTFTKPTAPTLLSVPSLSVPSIGSMPSTAIAYSATTFSDDMLTALKAKLTAEIASAVTSLSYTGDMFTDALLTSLKARLEADLATSSTGLGNAEAALFARETARQNSARAQAYTEITNMYAEWPMPQGAAQAQINRINAESTIRLADSSSQIMAESARLAVDYNKHVLSVSNQVIDLLGRLFDGNEGRELDAAKAQASLGLDVLKTSTQLLEALARVFESQEAREFEAAKSEVAMALDGFKATISVALAEADISKAEVAATTAANEALVQKYRAELESELAPVKTALEINQTKAQVYSTETQAAGADLQYRIAPEELKLKGIGLEADTKKAKAALMMEQIRMAMDTEMRHLTMRVEVLRGAAAGFEQMVASSLNSFHSSTSFGFSGSSSTSYTRN